MNKRTLTGLLHGCFLSPIEGAVYFIKESHFVVFSIGILRRFYFVHLSKGYVKRQILLRQGSCRQCGRCCSLLFTCPMLTREGLCRTYETSRWQVCKVFPIDERDIADVALAGGRCGYYFEKRLL